MSKRISPNKEWLLQELKNTIEHIESDTNFILNNGKISYANPLSVNLRKLYSPTRGDDLLHRIEKSLNIKLSFPDKSTTLPPKKTIVGLDDYRNRLIFAIKGKRFTRLDLIKIVADQKGAHTDDKVDPVHMQSEGTKLPFGNPARGGAILEQNTRYLAEIAKTTNKVAREQILEKRLIYNEPFYI